VTPGELYEAARKFGIATTPEMDALYESYWPERYAALERQFGPPIHDQGGAATPEALTDSHQDAEGERAEAGEGVKL
jgi:hypothetical protein